jgi:hypothetical protein
MAKLDKGDKATLFLAGCFILVWCTIVGTIGYVALHFITKFW